ncbi:MAG: diguanylate cyclase, partial [Gammaproteobacteria bacterium]|nr:diguanylate cyclase [Gammaproteobacteria bacterium]
MHKQPGRSQLQWTLSIGFGLIIFIMGYSWYDNRHHTRDLYEIIESSRTASEKMELIASMIEIARTRSRLTNQMIHTDDLFVKDEISMELNVLATKFSLQRQSLVDLGLSDKEQEILNYQREAILPTLALQRQAEEMALSDDPAIVEEAQKILLDDVYVGQGLMIDFFMELLKLQKSSIDNATIMAEKKYRYTARLETWLLVITLLLASAIAIFVIRRTGQIEGALFLEKERAQTTLRSIGDAVIATDEYGNIEYLNPIAEYMTGHLDQNIIGAPIAEIFKAYDEINKCWLSDSIMAFIKTRKYSLPSNDITLYTSTHEKIDIAVTIAPISGDKDKISGVITTFHDVTEAKILAKKLEHQARHDPLTGLLNRREFELRVNRSLELYPEDTNHALCVIDLDRFKIVNDTVGHTAGDELLKQISQRIKQKL